MNILLLFILYNSIRLNIRKQFAVTNNADYITVLFLFFSFCIDTKIPPEIKTVNDDLNCCTFKDKFHVINNNIQAAITCINTCYCIVIFDLQYNVKLPFY